MQKQKLEQKNTFKLIPVQVHFLKIISQNATEYEEYIKTVLEENEVIDSEKKLDEQLDETAEFILTNKENFSYQKKEEKNINLGIEDSFLESIDSQLNSLNLNEFEIKIAKYIIGSLDSNGYLTRNLYELSDDLLFNENININELQLQNILTTIQSLDPAGIGARNLLECMLIQLKRKNQSYIIDKTIFILENYYDLFLNRKFDIILKKSKISNNDFNNVINTISKLNPKPLSSYQKEPYNQTITPDYILKIDNFDIINLELNEKYIPTLKISKEYQNLAENYKNNPSKHNKNALQYVSQKIQGAKWFLDAVNQRQKILMNVGEFIIKYQYKYFISGEKTDLIPLTQKELSEKLNIDTSIISRLVNSKYIDTHFGVVSLRDIFSQKVSENLDDSSIKIKDILKEIIQNENKQKPYSDEKIVSIFKENGYQIARRTINKYREDLGILPARLRKNIL